MDRRFAAIVCVALGWCDLRAQDPILDVLDGETLYDGGSLVSLGNELQREERLRRGGHGVADATHAHQYTWTSTLAWQYGLRHDLQVGVAVPFLGLAREAAGAEAEDFGLGDVALLAKWRVHRWDAPGVSINTSVLGTLSLPTGEDDARDGGVEREPDLQLGSGGIDPALGLAITPEPGRWRFNAAVYRRWHLDSDGDGDRRGDQLFAELAIGNRFWLEPYPGPFLRFDVFAHYYRSDRDRLDDARLDDTGGQRLALGGTLAFRPRPSLDLQLTGEVPVWRDVNGQQLDEDWSIQLSLGYRF